MKAEAYTQDTGSVRTQRNRPLRREKVYMDKKATPPGENSASDFSDSAASGSNPDKASELRDYARLVRAMRRGDFKLDSLSESDPYGMTELGRELRRLGRWLDIKFSELRQLQKTAESLASGASLDELLDGIWFAFRDMIPYDRIGCAFVTENKDQVTSHWERSTSSEILLKRGFTAKLAGSSLQDIIATGKPRIINDLQAYHDAHPESVTTALILQEGIRASLTCPLTVNGTPIGFLFFSSSTPNTYKSLHKRIFIQIAGLVSSLVEKTRLYQEILNLNQELLQTQAALQELATRDDLTKLLNRRAIMEGIGATIARARRDRGDVAVIMADIDHFKRFNDCYGHQAGDTALRTIAAVFGKILRSYDMAGRFGGEEFVILLPDTALESACSIAERIRREIAKTPIQIDDAILSATISQGVAQLDHSLEETAEHWLARADAALYAAKHAGRDRVHAADSAGNTSAAEPGTAMPT